MNKSTWVLLLITGLLFGSAVNRAQSAEIYTWTDANGVVHYVDTPPENPGAVSIEVPEAYRPGSSDAYPQAESSPEGESGVTASTGSEKEKTLSYADQVRANLAEQREKQKEAKSELNRKCLDARDQLTTLEPSRRVFFTNEQGETERMDDVERVRLVAEAHATINKYCK